MQTPVQSDQFSPTHRRLVQLFDIFCRQVDYFATMRAAFLLFGDGFTIDQLNQLSRRFKEYETFRYSFVENSPSDS